MHGITGGMMSVLENGSINSGFLSGAISSLVASGVEALGSTAGAINKAGKYTDLASRNPTLIKALMITAGGLSGGISATIVGGKFMEGFRQGIITAGLNHAFHAFIYGSEEADRATKEDRDKFKDVRKAYYKFINDGKFASALKLAGDTFKFSQGLEKYFCGYDIRENDFNYFVTHSDASDGAWIEINTGPLSHFGTAMRMLSHEWHHVRQNYVFVTTNWIFKNHEFREWDAYTHELNNDSLPAAEPTQTQYWKTKQAQYWKDIPMHIKTTYIAQMLTFFQLR